MRIAVFASMILGCKGEPSTTLRVVEFLDATVLSMYAGIMKIMLIIWLAGCSMLGWAWSQQERRLVELERILEVHASQAKAKVGTTYQTGLANLNRDYAAALERALAAAQKAAQLERAIDFKSEIQRLKDKESLGENLLNTDTELMSLRAAYRKKLAILEEGRSKALAPLNQALVTNLGNLVSLYTKNGRLEDALLVKKKKADLELEFSQNPGADISGIFSPASSLGMATARTPFINSIGMTFVPVPDTDVLFCIHETRWSDYSEYAKKNPDINEAWKNQTFNGVPIVERPDEHPVVSVSWDDAKAFCAWLSKKEGVTYRLPTDQEWSVAVGIDRLENKAASLKEKSLNEALMELYPWGKSWPPEKGSGNLSGEESAFEYKFDGYRDSFPTTAPVGSFRANEHGIFDLAGNAAEWCEDWIDDAQQFRVIRGGWWGSVKGGLRSSYRNHISPNARDKFCGFRCVLERPKTGDSFGRGLPGSAIP